jgi:hypothetical protein
MVSTTWAALSAYVAVDSERRKSKWSPIECLAMGRSAIAHRSALPSTSLNIRHWADAEDIP